MGTGKTSLGKIVAANWNRPFFDTDKLIQEKTSQTIPEIFQKHGEAFFRQLEQKCVSEWLPKEGAVISTGGGILTNEKTAQMLKNLGVVIVLSASTKTIFERTKHCGNRPLLDEKNRFEKIEKLLAERRNLYARAGIQVRTDFSNLGELATKISRIFSHATE